MDEGSSRITAPWGKSHIERHLDANNGVMRNILNELPGRPLPVTADYLHELLHEVVRIKPSQFVSPKCNRPKQLVFLLPTS